MMCLRIQFSGSSWEEAASGFDKGKAFSAGHVIAAGFTPGEESPGSAGQDAG